MGKKSKAAKAAKAATVVVVEYPSAPVVIPPRLYAPIEAVCRDALHYGDNAIGMRDAVRKLIFSMRAIAEQTTGHVTADILSLEQLLHRTDPKQRELPLRGTTLDPITEMHRQAHLNADQLNAAKFIHDIWTAWGRHLVVTGHGFDSEGGGARELKDPVMSMGKDLWNDWKTIYTPWYEGAKKIVVPREAGGMVPVTRLIITIIMEHVFPGALDDLEKLKRGTCLRVLKEQLTALSQMQERRATTHG